MISWIGFVIAHEYSHTHRDFGEHEPDTVRDYLIFGGLAMIQQYLRRYLTTPSSGWAGFAWQESTLPPENHELPLVSIGGYLRVEYGVALSGDLTPNTSVIPLSFSTVQASLRRGKATGDATYTLVPDINAEANVLTALMCHADGKRPSSVCNRSVIKTVLKHVK